MNHQIEEKTLAAMRAISEARIENARLHTGDGDYRLKFEDDTGEVCWYLDVTRLVDDGYRP